MLRNPASRSLADELAKQVCRHGAAEFARLLNFTGLLARDPSGARQLSAATCGANRIGIWRKDEGAKDFVRDTELSAEWFFWAQVPSFPASSAQRRVLFLGESVARGMFYDPAYTPAQVLAELLQRELGADEVEVLDLARTAASMATLRAVTNSALQLKPDAVVIFAGNNWVNLRGYLEDAEHLYDAADSFRSGGATAFRKRLEQLLEQDIEQLTAEIGNRYSEAGIPVYWIIPEFNLCDWRDQPINSHWLDGEDENRQWTDLRGRAERQLRDREYARCLQTGEALLALDKGHCSTTLYLLADCHAALGRRDLQHEYLERARDSCMVDSVRSYTPRITTVVRDTLRRHLAATGQRFVDLKDLFATYLDGAIPGRRMFLDYCHLSSEAIGVSMAGIAHRLLTEVFGKAPGSALLGESVSPPGRKVDADAYLLAAIHNAHWEQSLDVVTHYCMQAAKSSPEALEVMRALVDVQNHRAPTWMSAKILGLLDSMSSQVKRYLISMEFKCIDRLLFEAFEACCRQHGRSLRQELATLRQEQHSVQTLGRVDLLDPYYHSTSFFNQQLSVASADQRHDFFKVYAPVCDFCFVADPVSDLSICVTVRVSPWVNREGEVDIRVNGHPVGRVKAQNEWTSWRFEVPTACLASGINEVRMAWPGLAKCCVAPVDRICADIQRQYIPPLYPTYGDIYAMTVQRC
jgi:hypothetical protein